MYLPAFFTTLLSSSLIPRSQPQTRAVAANNCSVVGYDKSTPKAFWVNSTITTAPACKTFCAAATVQKCDSFAVGAPGCLLYNVTVASNVTPMNGSAYTFYDIGCTI